MRDHMTRAAYAVAGIAIILAGLPFFTVPIPLGVVLIGLGLFLLRRAAAPNCVVRAVRARSQN